MASKKSVDKIFAAAATDAATLIARAVADEELPLKQRYDAALEILNRLFGKTPPKPEPGDQKIVVVLDEAAESAAQ